MQTKITGANLFTKKSTLIFLVWGTLLIFLSIFTERSPVFFDVLAQKDVSHLYQSVFPLSRYLFEPFLGIIFVLISRDVIWIGVFVLVYPLCRYYLRRSLFKTESISSEKSKASIFFSRLLLFYFWAFTIISSSFLIVVVFFYYQRGFSYIEIHGMTFLLTGFRLCAILFGLRILYSLIAFLREVKHPLSLQELQEKKTNSPFVQGLKEIGLFLGTFFILLTLNCLLLSIHFPTQQIITDLDRDEILFDFHAHTTASDGFLSPGQRVQWYMDQGISGAGISDHNQVSGSIRAKEFVEENNLDFITLAGQEYTSREPWLHLNIFGIKESIFPIKNLKDQDAEYSMNLQTLIEYVHKNGGWIIVNHYNGSVDFTRLELLKMGVDGFEISTGFLNTSEGKNRNFCIENNLICLGGSDEHENRELNQFVRIKYTANPQLSDDESIKIALQQGKHQVVKINFQPRKIADPRAYPKTLESIIEVINYFLNLDKLQLLSWFLWPLFLFLIYRKSVTKLIIQK